jgi:hypothetical protein
MANYVKSTDFAAKDALLSGDPNKIIKGTEIDNEFNSIAVAVSTKVDSVSPTFTGTPTAPTASPGTNTTQIATTAFTSAAITAAAGSLGLGTMASQNANNVAITGGSVTGITDLAVADGGTGASSITANSVVLGNGSSALSGNLVAPSTSGNVLTSNGTTWASTAPSVSTSSFTGANQSKTANGYQILPGGVIMQWGVVSVAINTNVTVTLPVAFTSTNYSVAYAIEYPSSGDASQAMYIRSKSTTSFVAGNWDHPTADLNWIAIGY